MGVLMNIYVDESEKVGEELTNEHYLSLLYTYGIYLSTEAIISNFVTAQVKNHSLTAVPTPTTVLSGPSSAVPTPPPTQQQLSIVLYCIYRPY